MVYNMNPFDMPPAFCKGKLLYCSMLFFCPKILSSSDVHHILFRSLLDGSMCRVHDGDDKRCGVAVLCDNDCVVVGGLHNCRTDSLLNTYE